MTALRWGILAMGDITHAFVADLRAASLDPGEWGSRRQASADFTAELGIRNSHALYEALVEHPDVDIIYDSTQHLAYRANARLALEHGMIEKPFTVNRKRCGSTARPHARSAKSQKACYVYDGLRQLTKAWTPAVSAACSTAPSAAGLAGVAPFWQEYSYDTASGNRSGVVSTSKSGVVASSSYAYPAAGSARPHAVTAVTGGAGAGSYGYDASGNQTARPGQTVVFDDVGKPVTITAGAETVGNVYDASGNLLLRVSATSGATLMLGDTVLSQGKGSTVIAGHRTYVGAGGMPVAQRSAKTGTTGNTLSWLFTSTDGTVDVVTNATTGATTQSYRDPFGAPLPGTGQAWGDGTGYLNKPVSTSIGLTTIGARVYDAVLGKFLSVDPVIDPDTPQQNIGYAYSGNNPTTYTDPTGLRFYITGNDGYVKRTGDHVGRPKTSTCSWGSPGCRGASTPTASDGSRTGIVNVCRAFDSTTCERKDARVAPNSTGMSRDEVKKMTARTDYYTENWRERHAVNRSITLLAIYSAIRAGGECALNESHHIFVCSGSPLATRGGTTFGDTFLLFEGNAPNVADGTDTSNEAMMAHEARHAAQWAAYGPSDFAVKYARELGKSQVLSGDPGCANWFEFDAGPLEGGYTSSGSAKC